MVKFSTFYIILQSLTVIECITVQQETHYANYVTSISNLQNLARHEQKVVKYLRKYSTNLKNKINKIKGYINNYSESLKDDDYANYDLAAINDTTVDPVQYLRLLRRFAVDLRDIEIDKIDANLNDLSEFRGLMDNVQAPTAVDRADSILPLLTLLDTYSLEAQDVSIGKLLNMETNSGLTSSQCLEIGHYAGKQRLFDISIDFTNEALKLLPNSEKDDKILKLTSLVIKDKLNSAINLHDENLEEGLKKKDISHYFSGPLGSSNQTTFLNRHRPKLNIIPIHLDAMNPYSQEMFNNFKTLCIKGYSEEWIDCIPDCK